MLFFSILVCNIIVVQMCRIKSTLLTAAVFVRVDSPFFSSARDDV